MDGKFVIMNQATITKKKRLLFYRMGGNGTWEIKDWQVQCNALKAP
jgi:hypothetical protein